MMRFTLFIKEFHHVEELGRVAGCGLAVFAGLSFVNVCDTCADVVVRPDGVRIHQQDWLFVPVVSIADDQYVDVLGALALRDPTATMGDNIVAVWYENPHDESTTWPAVSWESASQWEAVKWVKTEYGIEDQWDFVWPCDRDPYADATPPIVTGYDRGLLANDPLQDLGAPASHDEIVQLLVDVGYKAASIPADKAGPCNSATVLPALTDLVTLNVLFNPTETEIQSALASMVYDGCATGSLASWHPTMPPGTWTPRPAVPGLPPNNRLSLPGWPTVPVCVATTTGCKCTYLTTLLCTASCSPPPGAIIEQWTCVCPAASCPVTATNPGSTDPAAAGCFACTPTPLYYY